jgi:hypothetical protein
LSELMINDLFMYKCDGNNSILVQFISLQYYSITQYYTYN